MTDDQKQRIAHEAFDAAYAGLRPIDACPYPFASDEGRHWVAVWTLTYTFPKGAEDDQLA